MVDLLSKNGNEHVLYFYCKHDQGGKNHFHDILRSFLVQLAQRDTVLAARIHDACVLKDHSSIPPILESLGDIAFDGHRQCFLVIDGLDECPPLEAKILILWLSSRAHNEDRTSFSGLRILFAGQRTDILLRHLKRADKISLDTYEHQEDICEYVKVATRTLGDRFDLDAETESRVVDQVSNRAKST